MRLGVAMASSSRAPAPGRKATCTTISASGRRSAYAVGVDRGAEDPSRSPAAAGAAAALLSVAAVTAMIYGLREIMPVVSTGRLYLLAVLLIAIRWGTVLGVAPRWPARWRSTSSTCRRPGELTIADSDGTGSRSACSWSRPWWRAGWPTTRARARTRPSGGRARPTRWPGWRALLLAAADADEARAVLAARLSRGVRAAVGAVELRAAAGDARTLDIALSAEDERLGTLLVPRDTDPETLESLRRVAPSLAAMLAVARRREALESEVVAHACPAPAATRSRRRCCARSRTICARR